MPLKNYGVLKGKAIKSRMGKDHYQILMQDDNDTKYRVAVNVKSKEFPSEVLYLVSEDFKSENITKLQNLKSGFTEIVHNNPPIALDYYRGKLFNFKDMIPLPPIIPGDDNDLNEKIEHYIKEAIDNDAIIYAFGQRWGPENNKPDKYFKFTPGNGIHDIHMNQGSIGQFAKDNGIWQDGGILIHFENTQKWVGIFLAFQSQTLPTDENGDPIKDKNGNPIKNDKIPSLNLSMDI